MIQTFNILWSESGKFAIGFFNTIWLCLISGALSLALSTIVVLPLRSKSSAISAPFKAFVDGMRCIPFLLWAYFLYYCLPIIGITLSSWATAVVALVVYNTAYFSEILRGAWAHLPSEQEEAGRAFGYFGFRLFARIIGPQLFIAAGPVLGNQFVQLIKDSAFLMIITVPELTFMANFVQSTYFVPFAAFLLAVLLYWVFCSAVDALVVRLEHATAEMRNV